MFVYFIIRIISFIKRVWPVFNRALEEKIDIENLQIFNCEICCTKTSVAEPIRAEDF